MELTRLFLLSLGFFSGLATVKAENEEFNFTGTVWADGVGESGGWYDVNKIDPYDNDVDDLMCYAACAANLIAWWQNSEQGKHLTSSAPKDINTIWETYKSSNRVPDIGGDTPSAINWWMSGVYSPTNDAEWSRYYTKQLKEGLPLTFAPFSGYYYNQYGLTNNDLSDLIFDAWLYGEGSKDGAAEINFKSMFDSGACISLAIMAESTELAHAITLWGVEYEDGVLTKLWLTDSDDADISEAPRLFGASVTMGDNGKIYITKTDNDTDDWLYYGSADVYIDSVYAINSLASAGWQLVPEPSTATLSLLAFAGLAARRRRK
jgi:hypothetical protein